MGETSDWVYFVIVDGVYSVNVGKVYFVTVHAEGFETVGEASLKHQKTEVETATWVVLDSYDYAGVKRLALCWTDQVVTGKQNLFGHLNLSQNQFLLNLAAVAFAA